MTDYDSAPAAGEQEGPTQTTGESIPNYILDHGPALVERGHLLTLLKPRKKYPQYKQWQEKRLNGADLEKAAANGHAGGGLGILLGVGDNPLAAIDLDVYDEKFVALLRAKLADLLGVMPERVGMAPKTMFFARCAAGMTKRKSAEWITEAGKTCAIEILGKGQQAVLHGIHPGTDQPYQWKGDTLADVDRDELPELTDAIVDELFAYYDELAESFELLGWVKKSDARAPVTPVAPEDPDDPFAGLSRGPLNYGPDKIRFWLDQLDADTIAYSEWVAVGMALHHEFDGDQAGFALWDEWSMKGSSDKYDGNGTLTRWQGFQTSKPNGRVITARHIRRLVSVFGGAIDAPAALVTGSTDSEIAKLADDFDRTAYPALDAFMRRYVFISKGSDVFDLAQPENAPLRWQDFRNTHANNRVDVPAPTQADPDKTKSTPVAELWLKHGERLTAFTSTYDPAAPRLVIPAGARHKCVLNTFKLPDHVQIEPTPEMIAPFTDHLAYLIPDPTERRWFEQWCAFNIQRPEERCRVTPLHVSRPHGTGRGWVTQLFGRLLGHWNCQQTTMEQLCGEGSAAQYNDYMSRSLFVSIGEVRTSNKRFEVDDKIRDTLTEPTLNINRKYGGKGTESVYSNFWMASNHTDALVLKAEDRRIMVMGGPDEPRSDNYFDALYKWLQDDTAIAALYWHLMAYSLEGFEASRAPMTPTKREMIENTTTDAEAAFRDFLDSDRCPLIATEAEILNLLDFDVGIAPRQLKHLLKKYHCGKARHGDSRPTINGQKTKTLWAMKKNLTGAALESAVESWLKAKRKAIK